MTRVISLTSLGVLWVVSLTLANPGASSEKDIISAIRQLSDPTVARSASLCLNALSIQDLPALRAALGYSESPLSQKVVAWKARLGLQRPVNCDAAFVRGTAAYLIGQLGEEAGEAIPDLITALGDDDPEVRHKSSGALLRIGARAVPELRRASRDSDRFISRAAASLCERITVPPDRSL
jgi:HEAT repeat protein